MPSKSRRKNDAASRMAVVSSESPVEPAEKRPPSRKVSDPPFSPELAKAPRHPEEPTARGPANEPPPGPASTSGGGGQVRSPAINTKPVRTTVVLSPVEYDALQDLCRELERHTGRRGVAGSEVMRVLLGLARVDDDLGNAVVAKVTEEIERNGGNRRG